MRAGRQPMGLQGARAWAGVLAALVVLLQGLIPAAAIAHAHGAGVQICTSQGLKLLGPAPDTSHRDHGFGGLACEQCVMASFAAIAADAPPTPIRFAQAVLATSIGGRAFPARARDPPRPPSTAPPAFA